MKDGEVVVQLMEEDIEEENVKWTRAVILYVVGNTPSIGAIESTNEENERVLMNGPYTINNRPVIMRQWSENFYFNEEVLRTIPLWIKLPNLPLNLWSNQALRKIGSGLGKLIYANACTTIAERISYARILIEMEVTRPLPEKIKLCDPKGNVLDN
uniref:Uncharacterized protein LOC104247078 n=1 Tax=Nicotiana sylvestris TaxID=4096 RepID=A0A1U7YR63_NICSY|nr:PREDICTED: uncharacterized protein LOC104247078 [Nicotiana sylvestris]